MQEQDELKQLEFEKQVQEEAEKLELVKASPEKSNDPVEPIKEKVYTEDELQALEMGWNPDHEGENFVSAKEFIRVGEIIKSKRDQKKESDKKIDALQSAVQKLLEHNKKVEEQAYLKAKMELDNREREAVQSGDIEEFEKVKRESSLLSRPAVEVAPAQPQYSQDQLDFANKNKDWFNQSNPDLVDTVSATYDFLKNQDQKQGIYRPEAELLKEVENTVKAIPRFADRFPKSGVSKSKEARVGLVEAPSKATVAAITASPLSYDDKVLLSQIKMADPSFTEKDFLAMRQQLNPQSK